MVLVIDIVLILTVFRSINIEGSLNKDELLSLAGIISDLEWEFVKQWNLNVVSPIILYLEYNFYRDYDENDLVKYLQYKYFINFPIQLTYISKKLRIKFVLLYYYYKGFNLERIPKIFNTEQVNAIRNSHGITIVNAGPGSGKTTTACRKAFEYKDEGVIFISYSNSSVNEDKKRMYEYPFTSSLISSKKYLFSTIDKLAGSINKTIYESYDHSIKEACSLIEKRGFDPRYKHIIVDESQDIDEIRYNFIFTLFFFGNFKSLTIFGDPRQKVNIKAGLWYKNLWIYSENHDSITYKGHYSGLRRIGFTVSHRFKNLNILSLVNSLSSRRSELHCQLNIDERSLLTEEIDKPIVVYNINDDNENEIMTSISNYIKIKHENEKVPYSEFIVVGPSLEGDNQTSMFSRKISYYFRRNGIPCKLFSEGSYHADGILFSTIQSIKGMEADYVFLFGFNNYPNSFSMIPYDEAESLIYVSHSRARRQMFYVNNTRNMALPRGVIEDHIYNAYESYSFSSSEVNEYKKVDKKSVTSLSKCFDFCTLMETNKLRLTKNLIRQIELPNLEIPDDMQSDFFGTLIGMGVQLYCERKLPDVYERYISGNFQKIDSKLYNTIKRTDNLINGKNVDGEICVDISINDVILKEKIDRLNTNIDTMTNEDYYSLTSLIMYIHNSIIEEYTGNYSFDLHSYFETVAYIIKYNFGQIEKCEKTLDNSEIPGCIDILTSNAVIELKTKKKIEDCDSLQTFLYKALGNYKTKHAILINLRLKEIYFIDSNRVIEYWIYLIENYNRIREQVNFVRYNSREVQNEYNFPNNSFCIDTEFDPQTQEIFEIGIFNINEPYRSIIQTIKVSGYVLLFAKSWLSLTDEIFNTSITFNELINIFKHVCSLYDDTPILFNYICPNDYNWCSHEVKNVIKIDVGSMTKRIALKSGVFDSIRCAPKLIDFYNSNIEFITSQPHLTHHTALSDCLMLYAILKKFCK